jgi:hypothetical protein
LDTCAVERSTHEWRNSERPTRTILVCTCANAARVRWPVTQRQDVWSLHEQLDTRPRPLAPNRLSSPHYIETKTSQPKPTLRRPSTILGSSEGFSGSAAILTVERVWKRSGLAGAGRARASVGDGACSGERGGGRERALVSGGGTGMQARQGTCAGHARAGDHGRAESGRR